MGTSSAKVTLFPRWVKVPLFGSQEETRTPDAVEMRVVSLRGCRMFTSSTLADTPLFQNSAPGVWVSSSRRSRSPRSPPRRARDPRGVRFQVPRVTPAVPPQSPPRAAQPSRRQAVEAPPNKQELLLHASSSFSRSLSLSTQYTSGTLSSSVW